jgi:hypothetical protein
MKTEINKKMKLTGLLLLTGIFFQSPHFAQDKVVDQIVALLAATLF